MFALSWSASWTVCHNLRTVSQPDSPCLLALHTPSPVRDALEVAHFARLHLVLPSSRSIACTSRAIALLVGPGQGASGPMGGHISFQPEYASERPPSLWTVSKREIVVYRGVRQRSSSGKDWARMTPRAVRHYCRRLVGNDRHASLPMPLARAAAGRGTVQADHHQRLLT